MLAEIAPVISSMCIGATRWLHTVLKLADVKALEQCARLFRRREAGIKLAQGRKRYQFEHASVGTFQHHCGCNASRMRFAPPVGAQTPLIAGLQSRKTPFGSRRNQVIAAAGAERQKWRGHDGAYHMGTSVVIISSATAIAKVTGQGLERACNQRLAKNISANWINVRHIQIPMSANVSAAVPAARSY